MTTKAITPILNVELIKKALQTWPTQLAYSNFYERGTGLYDAVGHMLHIAGWNDSKDAMVLTYLCKLGISNVWKEIAAYNDEHYEEPVLVQQFVANLLSIDLDEEEDHHDWEEG